MNRRNRSLFVMLSFVAVLLITSCSTIRDISKARERQAKLMRGEIRIGVAWPFEAHNDSFKEGLHLALEQWNAKKNREMRFQLIEKDDHSSAASAMSVAQSFADNPEVVAVIGHRSSVAAVPASSIYEEAGLLFLAPGSTAPKLTQGGSDLIIRTIPNDQQIGSEMAQYIHKQGYQRLAIYYTDDEYGRGLAGTVEKHASAAGVEIVDRLSTYKDVYDLKQLKRKWEILGCDAVFIAATMPEGAVLVSGLRQAGLSVPIIAGDGFDSNQLIEVAKDAAEGVVFASIFDSRDQRAEVQSFVRAYREKYGATPGKWAAQGYDALMLLAAAFEAAGTRVPTDASAAVKGMKSWTGAAGSRSFEPNGDVQDMRIVKKIVRNGVIDYLE